LSNKGKIIYLNGVTSTGKTTLSKAIQQLANTNFYHISFDMFQQMISMKFLQENYWKYLSEAIIATYNTAKTLSDMNINVIIDGMLLEMPEFQLNYGKSHYEIFNNIFLNSPMLLTEVFCPLEECRKRNIERGDRGANQSDWQNDKMAKNIEYDFSVNTFANSSDICAELILSNLFDRFTV
jgi:chloramphenicol 3-O phosphotransferase